MIGFLDDNPSRPMPLTRKLTSTWTPKHDKGTTTMISSVRTLSSEECPTQFVAVVGSYESFACTLSLQKLLAKLNAFGRVTVGKEL
jgi:hypothetical protein